MSDNVKPVQRWVLQLVYIYNKARRLFWLNSFLELMCPTKLARGLTSPGFQHNPMKSRGGATKTI